MDNLRGIVLLVFAMACFAIEDLFIKTASDTQSTGQILFLIGIGGALFFGIYARVVGQKLIQPAALHRTVIYRNIGEIIGTLCFVTAISVSALSTSTAIFQATPLATTLGAALFLKEPVGWRRWSAIIVGFMGVMLIIRPGSAAFEPASLLALGAVLGLAARDLSTRVLPKEVSTLAISCYAFLAIGIAGPILMLVLGTPIAPMDATQWKLIGAALVFSLMGYYALTAAMRLGEMGVIMPFRYTRLIFAMIIGLTFFDERPDALTYLGAAIIIASGIYTLFRERKQRLTRLSTASSTR
ncbi:DMT family transporter [Donghicola eburneus]|uniref:Putative transporter, RhaT family, DMT superfamily n=1 Tax=Donghicola eburneus TaxID=393278 RepID=A0A1M4MZ77_9RHOB|nr:DMT family transporter [Donghicola eburneus]SCM67920.1 putative transporter, RhaT family, DMT superfamily [Donghicola eburneus]SFQ53964.1 Permease of the drug/metabolite transporter (DMT) superfamily [Donghicola eburneus]